MGMLNLYLKKQVINVEQDFREESCQNENTDNVQVHKKISFHSKVIQGEILLNIIITAHPLLGEAHYEHELSSN